MGVTKGNKELGIVFVLLLCAILTGGGIALTKHAIKDAGGFRQIIVDAGKEIKSISKDINEED